MVSKIIPIDVFTVCSEFDKMDYEFFGIVVEECEDDAHPTLINLIFQFGLPDLLTLDIRDYVPVQPVMGHMRDRVRIPVGQHISFVRSDLNSRRITKPRDKERYSFSTVRCVRGIGKNADRCYVDLLRLILPVGPAATRVPEGVAFVAGLNYSIHGESVDEMTIEFRLIQFVDFSFESLELQGCDWPVRDLSTLVALERPLVDYSRRYEIFTANLTYFVLFLGDKKFLSLKNGNEEVVKLYAYPSKLALIVGRMYGAHVVHSMLHDAVYTKAVFMLGEHNWRGYSEGEHRQIVNNLETAALMKYGISASNVSNWSGLA